MFEIPRWFFCYFIKSEMIICSALRLISGLEGFCASFLLNGGWNFLKMEGVDDFLFP